MSVFQIEFMIVLIYNVCVDLRPNQSWIFKVTLSHSAAETPGSSTTNTSHHQSSASCMPVLSESPPPCDDFPTPPITSVCHSQRDTSSSNQAISAHFANQPTATSAVMVVYVLWQMLHLDSSSNLGRNEGSKQNVPCWSGFNASTINL